MQLIRKLGTKLINCYLQSFAVFLCPYCHKEVVRQLSSGKSAKSCGCVKYKNVTYGYSKEKLYKVWVSMKDRCSNLNHKFYKDYSGRGITICQSWQDDYSAFRG